MSGKWTVAVVAFLIGVALANRLAFLAPISGKS